jgi:hypothetical protein
LMLSMRRILRVIKFRLTKIVSAVGSSRHRRWWRQMDRHWYASVCILNGHRRSHGIEVLRRTVGWIAIARSLVKDGSLTRRNCNSVAVGAIGHGERMCKNALITVSAVREKATRDQPGHFGWR